MIVPHTVIIMARLPLATTIFTETQIDNDDFEKNCTRRELAYSHCGSDDPGYSVVAGHYFKSSHIGVLWVVGLSAEMTDLRHFAGIKKST